MPSCPILGRTGDGRLEGSHVAGETEEGGRIRPSRPTHVLGLGMRRGMYVLYRARVPCIRISNSRHRGSHGGCLALPRPCWCRAGGLSLPCQPATAEAWIEPRRCHVPAPEPVMGMMDTRPRRTGRVRVACACVCVCVCVRMCVCMENGIWHGTLYADRACSSTGDQPCCREGPRTTESHQYRRGAAGHRSRRCSQQRGICPAQRRA